MGRYMTAGDSRISENLPTDYSEASASDSQGKQVPNISWYDEGSLKPLGDTRPKVLRVVRRYSNLLGRRQWLGGSAQVIQDGRVFWRETE